MYIYCIYILIIFEYICTYLNHFEPGLPKQLSYPEAKEALAPLKFWQSR